RVRSEFLTFSRNGGWTLSSRCGVLFDSLFDSRYCLFSGACSGARGLGMRSPGGAVLLVCQGPGDVEDGAFSGTSPIAAPDRLLPAEESRHGVQVRRHSWR